MVALVLLRAGERFRMRYTNHRGETAEREVELDGAPFWGRTRWHPEPQWLVMGTDLSREVTRAFAVADMVPLAPLPVPE